MSLNSPYGKRRSLNEVHAHAVLSKNKYIVRYYSAWIENSKIIIQNEYCNCGDLAKEIEEKIQKNTYFDEMVIYCNLN